MGDFTTKLLGVCCHEKNIGGDIVGDNVSNKQIIFHILLKVILLVSIINEGFSSLYCPPVRLGET